MPPSPALRHSPRRDLRSDNHKRGRSFEGGFVFKEKDDDLVLFNEMQTKESDKFLLHSTDDFDDSFSRKLSSLSSFKLGGSIPVHGESSDLLSTEEEKNDYDWLLTPPETPLFHSLDDEIPPVNLVQSGRPRSKPISISRSTTMEKSHRSGRSSASPQRLSSSPRSGNSTFQTRGRPSSAPHSSPPPGLKPSTPIRMPSTPPVKPSPPVQRSSTPTYRKLNVADSSGRRGTSPVNSRRGNSASPKFHAWQSNIPGFSTDAPPNLRTSLAERPASYVRGSSPASRNGRDSSRSGRQSMSPTTSRSSNSSYGFDRDRFSSQSKGSVVCGDDDMDFMQSTTLNPSGYSVTEKVGPSNSGVEHSMDPSRTMSASSAPKRYSDSALRQMDRKSHQNMFRPLLSSVPSTAFYVGNTNSAFRPVISRNSSITTSSNASSELGANIAPDTEGSHDKYDMDIEREKSPYVSAQNDVFLFDKVHDINGSAENESYAINPNIMQHNVDTDSTCEVELDESEKWSIDHASTTLTNNVPKPLSIEVDHLEVDCLSLPTCSQCGRKFHVMELMDKNDTCPECWNKISSITVDTPERTIVFTNKTHPSEMAIRENKFYDETELKIEMPEASETITKSEAEIKTYIGASVSNTIELRTKAEEGESCLKYSLGGVKAEEDNNNTLEWQALTRELRTNAEQGESCSKDSLKEVKVEEGDNNTVEGQAVTHRTVNYHSETADEKSKKSHPNLKLGVSEAAGISLLLRRSGSSKWPVIQGRPFAATNIPCDDPSYVRDGYTGTRNSIGHSSSSISSSVDWSSSKHNEVRLLRQTSDRRDNLENTKHDLNIIDVKSSGSSSSGISTHEASVRAKSTNSENFDGFAENAKDTALNDMSLASEYAELDYSDSTSIGKVDVEENHLDHTESSKMVQDSASGLLSPGRSSQLGLNEDCVASGNTEDLSNTARGISDIDVLVVSREPSFRDKDATTSDEPDISGTYNHGSVVSPNPENDHADSHDSESDSGDSRYSQSTVAEEDPSAPKDEPFSVPNTISLSDHEHGILDESIGTSKEQNIRGSLTSDESTDTILFCRSIVHDMVYEAAEIALAKDDLVQLEDIRPTVTIPDKSSSDRNDRRGRTVRKRIQKSERTRERPIETELKNSLVDSETEIKSNDSLTHDSGLPKKVDSSKPPKLESKCNCTVM